MCFSHPRSTEVILECISSVNFTSKLLYVHAISIFNFSGLNYIQYDKLNQNFNLQIAACKGKTSTYIQVLGTA